MMIVLYAFAIVGALSLCAFVYRRIMHGNTHSTVIAEIPDSCENAECIIRCLMCQNPRSEIYIINRSKSNETNQILQKLCMDYERIHIADEQEQPV